MPSEFILNLEGDGTWPDLTGKHRANKLVWLSNGATLQMSCLPDGMSSGRASVAIRIDCPDGRTVVQEVSMRNFLIVAAAIQERYGDDKHTDTSDMALRLDRTDALRAAYELLSAIPSDPGADCLVPASVIEKLRRTLELPPKE